MRVKGDLGETADAEEGPRGAAALGRDGADKCHADEHQDD